MRDDHGAAREGLQCVFEGAEGFHVQVVCGLIEQDQVAALLERQRQVEAVALTTGEDLGWLLLVSTLEAEGGQVGARRHFVLADVDVVQAVGDNFPHGFFGVDVFAVLVHVGDLDGLADGHVARVRLFQTNDGLEQRRLTHTVGADDADNAVARQGERQVLDQDASVEALVQVFYLDDLAAEARRGRNLDFFEVELAILLRLGCHLFVALQTCLVLGLACLRRGTDPLEFLLQALLQLLVLLAGNFETLSLLLQVGGVVAFVRVELAAVDLTDPFCDVVQEVAVVGNCEHGTRVGLQVALQPEDGFGVEVVGGLVEKQEVRLAQQQFRQCYSTTLTTRQVGHRRIRRRAAQSLHGLFDLGVDLPRIGCVEFFLQLAHFFHELVGVVGRHFFGDFLEALLLFKQLAEAFFDVAADGLFFVERRLLQQDANGGSWLQECFAVVWLVDARHDLQQRRFTGAVRTHNADLGAWVEGHGDVVQDDFFANGPADVFHRVDELSHYVSPFVGECGR